MTALPQPSEVIAFLNDAATQLDQLGKDLEAAHLDLGDAETVYEDALDEALLAIVDEYQGLGKRLPGEDVRLALARRKIDFSLYSTYRKAKRRVEGLNLHSRKLETAISARQSTLKGLREGMTVEGYGTPGETFPARQGGYR